MKPSPSYIASMLVSGAGGFALRDVYAHIGKVVTSPVILAGAVIATVVYLVAHFSVVATMASYLDGVRHRPEWRTQTKWRRFSRALVAQTLRAMWCVINSLLFCCLFWVPLRALMNRTRKRDEPMTALSTYRELKEIMAVEYHHAIRLAVSRWMTGVVSFSAAYRLALEAAEKSDDDDRKCYFLKLGEAIQGRRPDIDLKRSISVPPFPKQGTAQI